MMVLVSFVAFFAMVVAWLVTPSAPVEQTAPVAEAAAGPFIAAESAA